MARGSSTPVTKPNRCITDVKDGQGNSLPRDPDDPTAILCAQPSLKNRDGDPIFKDTEMVVCVVDPATGNPYPTDGEGAQLVPGAPSLLDKDGTPYEDGDEIVRCIVNSAGMIYPTDGDGNQVIDATPGITITDGNGDPIPPDGDGFTCVQPSLRDREGNLLAKGDEVLRCVVDGSGVPFPNADDGSGNQVIDVPPSECVDNDDCSITVNGQTFGTEQTVSFIRPVLGDGLVNMEIHPSGTPAGTDFIFASCETVDICSCNEEVVIEVHTDASVTLHGPAGDIGLTAWQPLVTVDGTLQFGSAAGAELLVKPQGFASVESSISFTGSPALTPGPHEFCLNYQITRPIPAGFSLRAQNGGIRIFQQRMHCCGGGE